MLCELVHEILLERAEPTFLSKVNTNNLDSQAQCLANLELAIRKMKSILGNDIPIRILALKPQQLYASVRFCGPSRLAPSLQIIKRDRMIARARATVTH